MELGAVGVVWHVRLWIKALYVVTIRIIPHHYSGRTCDAWMEDVALRGTGNCISFVAKSHGIYILAIAFPLSPFLVVLKVRDELDLDTS